MPSSLCATHGDEPGLVMAFLTLLIKWELLHAEIGSLAIPIAGRGSCQLCGRNLLLLANLPDRELKSTMAVGCLQHDRSRTILHGSVRYRSPGSSR